MKKYRLDQAKTPLFDALQEYRKRRIVAFDVPGHKQGKGNPELTDFLGKKCLSVDTNSMKMLDNLIHPVSVIKKAEELAADAFGAAACFFMVNGTSSAVQAMVMSSLNPGDKIIMPRNVHRSAINALILAGAIPVYVNPGEDSELGIPLGMSLDDVKSTIAKHPEAKAILVNNPTYYGVCTDLRSLVKIGHAAGMRVLVDEAHGTHFYFGEDLPVSAMAAGADMAAVSTHKTGGSLTQSSLLLVGQSMVEESGYIRQIINLTQTTSASYLLLSSLDITRRNLALRGQKSFAKVRELAEYARTEINQSGQFYAFGRERIDGKAFFDFDTTKLSIHTRRGGLAGIEVYDLLRDEYDIQTEFGDLGNLLAIISVGDSEDKIERLLAALTDIGSSHREIKDKLTLGEYIEPKVVLSPTEAFYAKSIQVPLEEAAGRICTEFVMCYPPGIPILAPGEEVTKECLDYIAMAKAKGCSMTGTEDLSLNRLNVLVEVR